MECGDLILVSVDDHVVEPPDMFEGRVSARYRDRAPHVVRKADGAEVWRFEDQEISNIGLNAVVGRPPEEHGMEPIRFDQMRRGCYDVHARVRDMDANGVLGALCFPSFPRFCGQVFLECKDKDLALAMVRAYNDWHIEEWCGSYPERFIPLALPVMWDVDAMVEEVRRLDRKGCHAMTFSENPAKLGLPSFHSDYWNPLWEVCSDVGTVLCAHIGSSSEILTTSEDAPIDVLLTVTPLNILRCAADLVWSPILRRYPQLRMALSEGGIGWVPSFLDRIDTVYRHHGRWTGQDFEKRMPSDLFLEQVLLCFISDRSGIESLVRLNIDNVMWENDYPHSDGRWPDAPEVIAAELTAVPPDVVEKVTHQNAMRHFRYQPFHSIASADATVHSLRSRDVG